MRNLEILDRLEIDCANYLDLIVRKQPTRKLGEANWSKLDELALEAKGSPQFMRAVSHLCEGWQSLSCAAHAGRPIDLLRKGFDRALDHTRNLFAVEPR